MTGKQRAYLRGMANRIDTIFQIGKGGITDETVRQVGAALEARELIKPRVLDNSEYSPRAAADELSQKLGADAVSVIGTRFVLYRVSEKKPRIVLPD